MLLSLDWMNLFGGLSSGQVTSVIVVAVIFTAAAGLTLTVNRVGSLLTPFFARGPITDWASALWPSPIAWPSSCVTMVWKSYCPAPTFVASAPVYQSQPETIVMLPPLRPADIPPAPCRSPRRWRSRWDRCS